MPYESSLDKNIFSKSWEYERGKITVGIWTYNDGPKKLQITRENKDKEGVYRFTRLGRLFKEEIEGVLPLIQEAMNNM